MIDASVVVVSYNTRDLLRNCLASIDVGATGVQVETIVVDNASPDGSADMVAREFPSVRLIRNEHNDGFAAANNIGLDGVVGRYAVLLNPDTVVEAQALTRLIEFMDAHPSAGYCGPRLLNGDGSHQPSARRFPTVLSTAYTMSGVAVSRPHSRHALNLHAVYGDREDFHADWMTGACLVVRAEAIRDVGLLDDGFFLYFEETDWCRRMFNRGWEGWYVGSAVVVHLGGQSVSHETNVRPFSGDHPLHWVNSTRRYMRRYYGLTGLWASQGLQLTLYLMIWLRHRWRSGEVSRGKAAAAALAIRYLLGKGRTA